MATETEKKLDAFQEIGRRIDTEYRAKAYIFIVTPTEGDEVGCMAYVLTEEMGPGRTSRLVKYMFREEFKNRGLSAPTRTPAIVARNAEELATKFLAFAHSGEYAMFWPFFRGECIHGKGPDTLLGKVGKFMRRELGMKAFKDLQKELFNLSFEEFEKGLSKRL